MKTPTPEIIDRALARLGKPGANAYFFDRLNNPAWVSPLYDRGFFQRPPEPDRTRNDGTMSLPDWPELRYLLKMAPLVPDVVGPIAVAIPDTENARVRELQLEIGPYLRPEECKKLADRALRWLDDVITIRHFAEPFAPFIVHLLKLGNTKRALRLARRLFDPLKTDDSPPRIPLDAWHFERYLNACLPTLGDLAGLKALAMLRSSLVASAREPGEGRAEDFSYIWRRDLLQANFAIKQTTDVLIDAVRDTALNLARRADIGFEPVRTLLLDGNRLILTRIAIWVAAQACDPNDLFVLETLLNTSFVDRFTCRAEYSKLLQTMFPRMSPEAQQQIVAAMSRDPLQTIPESTQQTLSPERLAQRARAVRRDRLTAFGAVLPTELLAERDGLIGDLGEPQKPGGGAVWHGPTSPLNLDSLGAMTVSEVVDYLVSWNPSRDFGAPSREGLARDLQQLAKDRAALWSQNAPLFIGLNPTYVRGIILALNDASAAKVSLTWSPVLELVNWVLAQPRETNADRNDDDEDPDWTWTRQAIARFVTTGLTDPESQIDIGLRESVWQVLQELLVDPDPATEADPVDDDDPLTTSINTVRGLAAHALFRFAWWIHRSLPAPVAGAELSFHRMPEVRSGLEMMLADASPAVHSVLGDWFRTMFFFDPRWTAEHLDRVFPESSELYPFWVATWRAFAEYDHPYDPAFGLLKRKYVFAVDKIIDASEENRKKMGEAGLGQHLMSYYWRGVGAEGTRALLLRYFDFCSPTAAAHALWGVGQGLAGSEPVTPETVQALAALWSDLTSQATHWTELKRREVYRQFGRWFSSGRFENRWALQELARALRMGAGMLDVEEVLARLEAISADHPREVAATLEILLKDEGQLWQPLIWKAQVESLLRTLLNSADETARAQAEQIVNALVENGGLFARDILGNPMLPPRSA